MSSWGHLKAELKEGAGTFGRWWKRAWLTWTGLHVVLGLYCCATAEESLGMRLLMLVLIPVYGAVQGLLIGLGVGAAALVLRMCGWAILVPLVLAPVAVWLSFRLGTPWIESLWDQFVLAAKDRVVEMGSMKVTCSDPYVFLVFAPLLLVVYLWSGPLWWATLKLLLLLVSLLAAGLLAATAVSTPILAATTLSRVRRRARERGEAGGKQP